MRSALHRWLVRALPPVPPLARRHRWWLVGLVAVGAVLRIVWATLAQEPQELRDPVLYLLLGDQLADGEGYSYPGVDGGVTAYYPPGYPLLLGALIWLVGVFPGDPSAFDVAIATNVVLSVALIPLVFALGRRLAGVRVGLVAAAVVTVWPNLVFHSGVVLTETLFLVLFVAMLLVALATPDVARHPGWRRVVATGLLLGAAGLVRPVTFVVAPLFLVLWWGDGVRRAVAKLAVVGLAAVALVVPWTVRNAVTMDSPILLSANFGDNFCIGNHPGATGGYRLPDACFEGLESGERPAYEVRRQSETLDRGLTFVREHPADVVGLLGWKAYYTLSSDHDGLVVAADWGERPLFEARRMDLLESLADGAYYAVLAAAVLGVALLVRNRGAGERRWLFLLLTVPLQMVPPLVTFGEPRFKMPIYPVLAVAAALGVTAAWRATRGLDLTATGDDVDVDAVAIGVGPDAPAGQPAGGGDGDRHDEGDAVGPVDAAPTVGSPAG